MAPAAAAPFYGFRFSSSTSIDVLVDKQTNTWNGLVSISEVSIDEILRQAKIAFPDMYKAILLVELPRMLTWGGSKCPKTDDAEGASYFEESQVVTCELEDPTSGEIEEKKITCTVEKFESVSEQANELLQKLADEDDVQQVPQVGLDAMLGGGSRQQQSEHDEDFEDDEEEDDDEPEEGAGSDDEENDEDFKHGLGASAGPPEEVRAAAIKAQLKSIVQLAQMMGVPNPEIREAWTNCGGILVENPTADGEHGGDCGDDCGHDHGAPQGGCKQQ